ncbi:MAG: beta-galactosidase [Acidobacteriota bacterium]|nr:beta-galactosidase [Acidobacteriota bacterium]
MRRLATEALLVLALLFPSARSLAATTTAAAVVTTQDELRLGAAWYPEQWPESRWDADLALMQRAGLRVVRVGEFAWSRMEPSEGHYDLDWLARAIAAAGRHHLQVVIGTPTDAPPAWLTARYPETLGTNADGSLRQHGNRRQFNYANPRYRAFCRDIVTQLAQRFGHDPNVIGWQIGNEYTDESYDAATRAQFQHFLQQRYTTLDALNQRWSTAYWSQHYDSWAEIPLNAESGNPGLMLEHRRFVTATWQEFQHVQVAVLRRLTAPQQFVTTNVGGLAWSENWDHYAMQQELDLASWDDYVGSGHLDATRNAFLNDFVRGWKRQNFWVMETQPGSVNWAPISNALDRGETRELAWQTVAHGADAVLYWQWRSALNGQEQYHGAIVGPDGEPLPLYDEVRQTGQEFERLSSTVAGTTLHAEVALLVDYDSRWAIDFQRHNSTYDQLQVLLRWYQALRRGGRNVDVVNATAPLDQYKLVIAPNLNVLPASLAEHLLQYVRGGGSLVLGPRSGMKDWDNALQTTLQPGPLAAALGAHVAQYYALSASVPIAGQSVEGSAETWAERLATDSPDAHVLLRYGHANGWLDGQPAAVQRTLARGSLAYVDTVLDATLTEWLTDYFLQQARVPPGPWPHLPPTVEAASRTGRGKTLHFLLNHGREPVTLALPWPATDLLDTRGRAPNQTNFITLQPHGVAVLEVTP